MKRTVQRAITEERRTLGRRQRSSSLEASKPGRWLLTGRSPHLTRSYSMLFDDQAEAEHALADIIGDWARAEQLSDWSISEITERRYIPDGPSTFTPDRDSRRSLEQRVRAIEDYLTAWIG